MTYSAVTSIYSVVLLSLVCVFSISEFSWAEKLSRAELKDELMGRNIEELKILLGPPDNRVSKEFRVLNYGKSQIFMDSGQSIALIDGGDLLFRRLHRPDAQRQIRKLKKSREVGWVNAWTHSGKTKVVKELIE